MKEHRWHCKASCNLALFSRAPVLSQYSSVRRARKSGLAMKTPARFTDDAEKRSKCYNLISTAFNRQCTPCTAVHCINAAAGAQINSTDEDHVAPGRRCRRLYKATG
ncbi:hypothetical protein MTO96_000684 [Rhipicephalus appendiculatus]